MPRASAATTPARCSCSGSRRPRPSRSTTASRSLQIGPPIDGVVLGRQRRPRRSSCPPRAGPTGAVAEVLDGVLLGQQVGLDEIVTLFGARGPEVAAVAELADELRRDAVGDVVTYVHNRNINYTNVCTFKCRFCGFSQGPAVAQPAGHPLPAAPSTTSPSAPARRPSWAPPRSASRAASTPTSTATTTSTSPGR